LIGPGDLNVKLVDADIIRDGGSLFALFRNEDGSLRSIDLRVVFPPEQPRRFGQLFDGPTVVTIGSEAEASVVHSLESWLAHPEFENGAKTGAVEYVQELLRHMHSRAG
jgi:hypothetical protein